METSPTKSVKGKAEAPSTDVNSSTVNGTESGISPTAPATTSGSAKQNTSSSTAPLEDLPAAGASLPPLVLGKSKSTGGHSDATIKEKHSKKKSHHKSASTLPFIPAASDKSADPDYNNKKDDRIRLGICAMDKKARSKPMAEILSRLDEDSFQVVFFGDDVILNKPVDEWPICHVLIAFYSKGYPLQKTLDYVDLRKPFSLNDLSMQSILKDRRRVYDLLEGSGIDVPRHAYLSRDDYVSTGTGDGNGTRDQEVVEHDDHIEVNGVSIHKPFVEKPVDADDHNIAIYYPTSAGGGCKKLFRKIGNRSSEFYPDINDVRRDGSYIYEEFVETQGTDVKMYTVGPEYGHAEARKSPAVDGKVERNSEGKEVRFPVILTLREKEIARRIVLVFKQFVCGFDLLRVQEGHSVVSYVCDVNGFSFVKNSRKYYDDCAQILTEHIHAAVKPGSSMGFSTLDPLVKSVNAIEEDLFDQDGSAKRQTFLSRATRMLQGEPTDEGDDSDNESKEEQSVHKSTTVNSPTRSDASVELLSTAAATLEEGAIPVRDIPNHLMSEPASMCPSEVSSQAGDAEPTSKRRSGSIVDSHQEELRCVIAVIRHGDRTPKQKLKVQMTEPLILQYFHDHSSNPKKDLKVKAKAPMTEFLETVKTILARLDAKDDSTVDKSLKYQLRHMRDVLERWKIAGLNRKLQIKPKKWEEYQDENGVSRTRCTCVQLILKWGGNLTKLGEKQSVNLGQRFRHEMYPDAPGGGILRLHSTFRHDLKIKTSDEGRVMKTAAAFAKGLLELEGDLPPILVSLVHKEKGSMHMLDPSGNKEVKAELDECKEKITANLQKDVDVREAPLEVREQLVGPRDLTALHRALNEIGNPRKTLLKIHEKVGELIDQLDEMLGLMGSGDELRIEGGEGLKGEHEDDVALSGVKLYKGETLLELCERWRFLYKNLYDQDDDQFDLSRIPDVHDNVRFDVLHNPHLGLSSTLEKLYHLAKNMADCVVPQEYGTTVAEKRSVGVKISRALLEKIMYDLSVARADNEVDMRYMINMAYSTDLPINTMGRRIRTRLYFTSESHLHTLLNVLRFAGEEQTSVLSEHGVKILNGTNELCYLTQVVFRLFEDGRRDPDDPRRFRVEILCSPGATATPMHMHEQDRDNDPSRFDTAKLEMIGREGLTCQELEDFFNVTILEGATDAVDEDDQPIPESGTSITPKSELDDSHIVGVDKNIPRVIPVMPQNIGQGIVGSNEEVTLGELDESMLPGIPIGDKINGIGGDGIEKVDMENVVPLTENVVPPAEQANDTEADANETIDKGNDTPMDIPSDMRNLDRKYFWSTVAVGSFMLAASCLALALNISGSDARRGRRYNTRR